MTCGIIIPTLNAARELAVLLTDLHKECGSSPVLVIDSSSTDNTRCIATEYGAQVIRIDRAEFNHGSTREQGRQIIATEIVIFLTQDVLLKPGWFSRLIAPIVEGRAVATYARQNPRDGAGVLEACPRSFNYPAAGEMRSIEDAAQKGVRTFFCSDSCAAYLNRALDQIGGFETLLTNEDYFAVARLLYHGGSIAYVSEAEVIHSHRYTLGQEFQRYFDNGYVRGERPWVQELVGHAESRGASLVKRMLVEIARTKPWLLPYAIAQAAAKWAGYRIGFHSTRAPLWWKRALSAQKYYWNSPAAAIPPRPAPWHQAADWTALPHTSEDANRRS